MGERFPEMLLPEVLDHTDLESLVLSAMPMSRCWREQACAHPTYWLNLAYTGRDGYDEIHGFEQYDTHISRLEGSLQLFLLRLSRTHSRPIVVSLRYPHPRALSAIGPHLQHVRGLSVTVRIQHWQSTADLLCSALAPLLESLVLQADYRYAFDGQRELHSLLPRNLFAGQPAALTKVRLYGVDLPSASELAPCLRDIDSLLIYVGHWSTDCVLPNVFAHCCSLSALWICGYVKLEDPAFLRAETWAGVEELGMYNLDDWAVLALPFADIQNVILEAEKVSTAVEFISSLGPRLSVELPLLQHGSELGEHGFYAEFTVLGGATRRRRPVHMRFPNSPHASPKYYTIHAFQDALVAERVVELTLHLENWDMFVGQRYLAGLPQLEGMVVVLCDTNAALKWIPGPGATLSCPRLERLTVRSYTGHDEMMIDASDLLGFARCALPDAPFPINLALVGATLCDYQEGIADLFASCFTEI